MKKAWQSVKNDCLFAKSLIRSTFITKPYNKNRDVMGGLYKRAFYNECLLGFGQVLLFMVTFFYIEDKELRD